MSPVPRSVVLVVFGLGCLRRRRGRLRLGRAGGEPHRDWRGV